MPKTRKAPHDAGTVLRAHATSPTACFHLTHRLSHECAVPYGAQVTTTAYMWSACRACMYNNQKHRKMRSGHRGECTRCVFGIVFCSLVDKCAFVILPPFAKPRRAPPSRVAIEKAPRQKLSLTLLTPHAAPPPPTIGRTVTFTRVYTVSRRRSWASSAPPRRRRHIASRAAHTPPWRTRARLPPPAP